MTMRNRQSISKVTGRAGKILLGIFAVLFSLFLVLLSGVQGTTLTMAAVEYTDFEKSPIEEDFRMLSAELFNPEDYPKDANSKHRLLDNVGFMEYAYTTNAVLTQYYGIYFYVYNPTEKEVSARDGANVVNMATAYNSEGEPASYENVAIRLLGQTANRRFLKFGIVNKRGLYDRVRAYAGAHNGERRYDIAGIQLWFRGEQNATDANTERDETSYTYLCTGFCAGCAPDGSEESTLKVERKKLETVGLDIQHTYYRTSPIYDQTQQTLTSVYFSIPNKLIRDYGALQIVDAEWYEYKTSWIFVTDDDEIYQNLLKYAGTTLPQDEIGRYYDPSFPYEIAHYLGSSSSGIRGIGYNHLKAAPALSRYDWVIKIDDIKHEVDSSVLADYAANYAGNSSETDEKIDYGEKKLNAHLFSDEVDEGRTRGYNHKKFDARNKDEWINLKLDETTSGWNQFLNLFRKDEREFLEARDEKPIKEVVEGDFFGMVADNKTDYANTLLVAASKLDELHSYTVNAAREDKATYLLRIGLTDYEAIDVDCYPTGGSGYDEMYFARDTTYLDFDIIYFGFVKGTQEKIIPVVASPIDIYPTLTPPPKYLDGFSWTLVFILCGVIAGVIAVGVIIHKVKR